MIVYTTWDIGQNMYCNYLIPILWRHDQKSQEKYFKNKKSC